MRWYGLKTNRREDYLCVATQMSYENQAFRGVTDAQRVVRAGKLLDAELKFGTAR